MYQCKKQGEFLVENRRTFGRKVRCMLPLKTGQRNTQRMQEVTAISNHIVSGIVFHIFVFELEGRGNKRLTKKKGEID